MRDLAPAVARLRHLLDLDADPSRVDAALAADPALADERRRRARASGCPAASTPRRLLLRTMIGQQISLAAAATATAPLVAALGAPVDDAAPDPRLPRRRSHCRARPRGAAPDRRAGRRRDRRRRRAADGTLLLHAGRDRRGSARGPDVATPGSGRGRPTTSRCARWPTPTPCSAPTSWCAAAPPRSGCDLTERRRWAPLALVRVNAPVACRTFRRGAIPPALPDHEDQNDRPLRHLPTPLGPFTALVDDDGAVLASGWTADAEELRALIHPSLRPAAITPRADLRRRDPRRGPLPRRRPGPAIDAIAVQQHSGEFLVHAWDVLRDVPAGDPITYTEFAVRSGRPAAVRGAASACARNAAALFVPCHRVVRVGGALGGFRWGLPAKRWLLSHEG